MSFNNEPLILDGTKLAWHKDRVDAWLRGERIAPITIDCALSSNCTYKCIYCYGKMQRMRTGYLPRDVVLQFLDDAAEIGVKAISFVSDGESTCSPYLYEAIEYGYAQGLDMALGTNGYLLQDDKLADILPKLVYLRFNISSGTSAGYQKIHGVSAKCFEKVRKTIFNAVKIKRENNLSVTIGLQMVLMPEFVDEIMPLAKLGKELGVDYLVIKHCSDDENNTLGVDYAKYADLEKTLREAEAFSTPNYFVKVKWSKIMSEGKRTYSECYGTQFIIQFSGTGVVAPCGMLFNDKYKDFHIGNLNETRLKDLWKSERYWEVMEKISSAGFNAKTDCGTLCLQHKVNEALKEIKVNNNNTSMLDKNATHQQEPILHINFI